LKYPNQSTFFVRNRAAATSGGTGGVTDGATAGTVDVTAGSDSSAGTAGTTAGTAGTSGATAGSADTAGTNGETTGDAAGTAGTNGETAADSGDITTGGSSSFGCVIGGQGNDPTLFILLFGAMMVLFGRGGHVTRGSKRLVRIGYSNDNGKS